MQNNSQAKTGFGNQSQTTAQQPSGTASGRPETQSMPEQLAAYHKQLADSRKAYVGAVNHMLGEHQRIMSDIRQEVSASIADACTQRSFNQAVQMDIEDIVKATPFVQVVQTELPAVKALSYPRLGPSQSTTHSLLNGKS